MDSDCTVRWNPHIQDDLKDEILDLEWEEVPEEFINDNHSSDNLQWDEETNYFKKIKNRNPSKTIQELTRTGEFDHRLMLYEEHHDANVCAPTPYCAILKPENEGRREDEVIMDFMGGNNEWLSFPKAFSEGNIVEETEVRQVCEGIGQFAKILENESMIHGDIALRHFYVDQETYDIGIIDIEGGSPNARALEVQEEINQMENIIERIPRPQYGSQMHEWFGQGYESLPQAEYTDIPTSVYETDEGDNGYDLSQDDIDFLDL